MSSRSNLAELTLLRPFQTLTVLVPELDRKHLHLGGPYRTRTGTTPRLVLLRSPNATLAVPTSSGPGSR